MNFVKFGSLDPYETFFHFSKEANSEDIDRDGIKAFAGGENEAVGDKDNKTIYFSKGVSGMFKTVDVWARWEYDKYMREVVGQTPNYEKNDYDEEIMTSVIFSKMYKDFKERNYYAVDFVEGEDFDYGDEDFKKINSRDEYGRPYLGSLWKYGPYSDWGTTENPNNTQEPWNMYTKIGERVISNDRFRMITDESDSPVALDVILEAYDKYRDKFPENFDKLFDIFDKFINYSKERMREISTQKLGKESVKEQKNVSELDEVLGCLNSQERQSENIKSIE